MYLEGVVQAHNEGVVYAGEHVTLCLDVVYLAPPDHLRLFELLQSHNLPCLDLFAQPYLQPTKVPYESWPAWLTFTASFTGMSVRNFDIPLSCPYLNPLSEVLSADCRWDPVSCY